MTLHGPAPTVPVPGNTRPEDGTLRWNAAQRGNKNTNREQSETLARII